MHLACLPTVWNEAQGVYPLDVKELRIAASPAELRRLAAFLEAAAGCLESGAGAQVHERFASARPLPEAIDIRVSERPSTP